MIKANSLFRYYVVLALLLMVQDPKKIWGQAVERLCEKKDYTVKYSCSLLDHTKQANPSGGRGT